MFYTVFIFLFIVSINGQFYEGDVCTKDNFQGVCTNIRNCKTAIEDIRNHRGPPKLCSFTSNDPIVCCLDNARQTTYRPPVATPPSTTPKRPRTTTEPPVYDYVYVDNTAQTEGGCEPISSNLTAVRTGQKAWDKCIEYQHKLVYPCERGVALINKKGRMSNCNHKGTQLIVGGQEAGAAEFPHMVLLGLEKDTAVSWVCGGTLISERFILTAGHCTSSSTHGKVKYARTGVLKRTDAADALHLYRISDVIKHPEYKPPSKYNDIALLKTERDIMLDQFVVPACLDVGSPNNHQKALATGWGATFDNGDVSNVLQKVTLEKFTSTECSELFVKNRRLEFGFDENTQICYGDKNERKDTCQGDSGGPLQLYHKQIHCMYTVVGVTSFGRRCGVIGEPGVYTRVASYVRWIESIVCNKVKYARTRVLDERDAADALHLYRISDVIRHPEYKRPIKYNDIALLKTERDIMLDQFVVPACLDVGRSNNHQRALTSGWGTTSRTGDGDYNILRKFTLDKFTTTECSEFFGRNRNLEFGFDEHTQLCYGDKNGQKDFCTGNSGAPLQVYHEQIHCMYTVVGLASFGRRCIFEPTVYTRVAPYVRWIESIVWP